MTITFTDDARTHLDRYLRRLRSALSSQLSVDVSDVERDIISHIDAELGGQPQPIDAQRLTAVLDRLGPPDRWLRVDDASGGDASCARASHVEWRLPTVILTLFVLGIFSFMRMILWPLPLLLMLVSVLAARAWLTTQHSVEVGERSWFVYPPLVAAYALLGSVLIAWPLPIVAGIVADNPSTRATMVSLFNNRSDIATAFVALAAIGVWWVVLGPVLYRFHRAVGRAFSPFADWFGRRHASWVTIAGAVLAAGSGALLYGMLP